ncbi:hypothetical protein SLW70_10490 [Flavobacterium sp. NG2]|uniref:hypothetical protein n=1 Tax=Flavobacterium sp. NG2 TaxID=3097547 RepID=UPI002A7F877F|nr:hypothetical protein [Flavobacterium sp. NG2]WPR70370.1 hypothetical protein SLW70_10490 [Flavobacterium sp. NG2]
MKLKSVFLRMYFLLLVTTQFSCTEIAPNQLGALVLKNVDQEATLSSLSVNETILHAKTFRNPHYFTNIIQ